MSAMRHESDREIRAVEAFPGRGEKDDRRCGGPGGGESVHHRRRTDALSGRGDPTPAPCPECRHTLHPHRHERLPLRRPWRPAFEKRVSGLAEQLVNAGVYTFWISIDSADPGVHESMRGLKGVWDGIRKAIPIFHRHGLYPSANLGINRKMGKEPYLSSAATLYDRFRILSPDSTPP